MLKTMGLSLMVGGAVGATYQQAIGKATNLADKLQNHLNDVGIKQKSAASVVHWQKRLATLKAEQDKLGGSNARLNKWIWDTQQRLNQATGAAQKHGINIRKIGTEYSKLTNQLNRASRAQEAFTKKQQRAEKISNLKGSLIGSAALAYGGANVIGSSMNLEQQQLYLKTVINAEDKDGALKESIANAKKLVATSLLNETQVMQIEYQLNSAGLSAEAARSATLLTHQLSKITQGQDSEVAGIFATLYNNMAGQMVGTAEEKQNQIANILAKTQFKYQFDNFGQVGESFKMASAQAVAMNLPLNQTAVLLGQLNNAGLKGSSAGTALSATLRGLNKASDELGFSLVRGSDGSLDMIATLENLKGSLDGMSIDEKAVALQSVFGDEGFRGISPMLEQIDNLKDGLNEVSGAAQSNLVGDTYKDFAKSSAGAFLKFQNSLSLVGNTLATTFLPGITAAFNGISSILVQIASFIQANEWLAMILGIGVGGFVGLTGAAIIFNGVMWASASAMGAYHTIMSGALKLKKMLTIAQWALNAAMGANPIGLIIAGVAALAGGLYWLYNNVEPVRNAFDGLFNGLVAGFSWLWQKIQAIGSAILNIGDTVSGVMDFFDFGDDEKELTLNKKQSISSEIASVGADYQQAKAGAVAQQIVNQGASQKYHAGNSVNTTSNIQIQALNSDELVDELSKQRKRDDERSFAELDKLAYGGAL